MYNTLNCKLGDWRINMLPHVMALIVRGIYEYRKDFGDDPKFDVAVVSGVDPNQHLVFISNKIRHLHLAMFDGDEIAQALSQFLQGYNCRVTYICDFKSIDSIYHLVEIKYADGASRLEMHKIEYYLSHYGE